jgi:hypothetical protein
MGETKVWIVDIFERDLGPGEPLRRLGVPFGEFDHRQDALDAIAHHIHQHDLSGRNDEQDYWWCRDQDDRKNLIFIIRYEPDEVAHTPDLR